MEVAPAYIVPPPHRPERDHPPTITIEDPEGRVELARQLARFLQVHAYLTGTLSKNVPTPVADVHLIDIASSGMSGAFAATDANPGTVAALAEIIAQRVASIVRISEPIRNCNEERKKGQFTRARNEANKALTVDPNSTGAWLCIATIYEAQRMPIDSVIAAIQEFSVAGRHSAAF